MMKKRKEEVKEEAEKRRCLKVPKRARERDGRLVVDGRETSGSDRGAPRVHGGLEEDGVGPPACFHARNEDERETESGSV